MFRKLMINVDPEIHYISAYNWLTLPFHLSTAVYKIHGFPCLATADLFRYHISPSDSKNYFA